MTTYLAIKGWNFGEILLDSVKETGETVRHLARCNTRFDACVLACKIVANKPDTLAMLDLKPGNYRLLDDNDR